MTDSGREDWLDQVLRQAADEPREAEAFTRQVMARLPPRETPQRARSAIILACTVLGGWLGLVLLPGGKALTTALATLVEVGQHSHSLLPSLAAVALVLTLGWTGVLSVRDT